MLSMLSVGIFEGLGNIFDILFDVLGAVFKGIFALPMFMIYVGVMAIAYFSEIVFKKLAGIDPIILNGQQLTGASGDGKDLVYGFITDVAVQNVFWSIVALSIVLLFICTLIALIKSEFTIDLKGSAKGPIIGRALKSLVNFITVPVVTIIAVLGTNFLTKSIYDMFGGEDSTIVTKCFYVGAYNANRARFSTAFASDMANNAYSAVTSSNNAVFNGTNPFAGKSQAEVANMIDQFFIEGKEITLDYNHVSFWNEAYKGNLIKQNATEAWEQGYVNWSLVLFGYPETDNTVSLINLREVNFFYDLSEFNFVLSIGTGIVMAWLLLSVGAVLLKRVFELTILFLLAPAMTAIAPLDGGQAEKKWRNEFMKRLLAVIGPIFAYNMYFLMVPLFENIKLFGGLSEVGGYIGGALGSVTPSTVGTNTMLGSVVGIALIFASFAIVFDVLFQLICIFVGLSIVKSASALLSSLLGIEDLVKSGYENTKKAIDIGKRTALGATAVTGKVVKGTASLIRQARAINPFSKGNKSARMAKQELAGAQKEYDDADEEVKNADKDVQAKTDAIDNVESEIKDSSKYKVAANRVEQLMKKKSEDENWNEANEDELTKAIKDRDSLVSDNEAYKQAVSDKKKAEEAKTTAEKNKEEKSSVLATRQRGISSELQKDTDYFNGDGTLKTDLSKKKQKKIDRILEEASLGSTTKERRKAAKELETGEGSNETSIIARTFKDLEDNKFYKNTIGKSKVFNKSMQEWLNPEDPTAMARRFNDALSGMFGDGGGGELWKIWFNKNSRANLYEGVPESKKRTAGIEQGLSWGAKAKVDDNLQADKARKEEEKTIRRMLVDNFKSQGGHFAELHSLYEQIENEKNPQNIENLQAQVKNLEAKTGITGMAREFYKKATSDNSYGQRINDYKEYLKDKGAKDAVTSEISQKQRAEKAYSEITGSKPLNTNVSNKDGKPIKVDMDTKSAKHIGDSIVTGLRSPFEGIRQAIENSNTDITNIRKALEELLGVLKGGDKS